MSDIGQVDFRVSISGGKYTAIRLVGGGTRWMRYDEEWEVATRDWQHAGAINALIDELHAAQVKLQGDAAEVGKRAAHYGNGIQPWDHIMASGWGPEFAAGNALKYVRRYLNKNGMDDLKKGRWYYHELIEMVTAVEAHVPGTPRQAMGHIVHSGRVLHTLEMMLTVDERVLLRQQ